MHPLPFLLAPFLALALPSAAAPTPAPTFPTPYNSETTPGAPMPAAQAAAQMPLPPGFHCTAFAAEPDVQQPIAITTDPRGRLWVAECYTYSDPGNLSKTDLRDRILIFEDQDNDGHFDKRTVFWDGAQRLTSLEVGPGGIYALTLPNLVFIPDANGDDIPDAAPEILLDGFDYQKAAHTVANGLRWGPDGWLYGRQGILGTSHVGKPGTPDPDRLAINTGIWRFHPRRHTCEIVAHGTTNPWGHDWDPKGEAFFINTVIGHLWHLIPGAHYRRMFGNDPNPHIYDLIDQHADHVHWATSEKWADVRQGLSDATSAAGGGHAHTGLLVYQGGQWPPEWTGKLLTINFHGRRLNVENLSRLGSGFLGQAQPDAFFFPDPWFRGIDLIAAPDGGVFVSDWSDAGECHDQDGIHRTSGRIYKISYGPPAPRTQGDLAALRPAALAALQTNPNDWLSRQARRVLAARAASPTDRAEAAPALLRIAREAPDTVHRLRALWALHVCQWGDADLLEKLLRDPDEALRAWALRLLQDQSQDDPATRARFASLCRHTLPALAAEEPSGLVRLALASLLSALPLDQRPPLAAALLKRAADDTDHNLPDVLWSGIEPLAALPDTSFAQLLAPAQLPRLQRFAARLLTEDLDRNPAALDALLTSLPDPSPPPIRLALVEGILQGLAGRSAVTPPPAWPRVLPLLAHEAPPALASRLRQLRAAFGDPLALEELRALALNPQAELPQRHQALQSLIDSRPPWLGDLCRLLLRQPELCAQAAASLALQDDPANAQAILAAWPRLPAAERPAVIAALLSRPTWASLTLDAIAAGTLPRDQLGAFQARQIRDFADAALTQKLNALLGDSAPLDAPDPAAALAAWQARLQPAALAQADPQQGRLLFNAVCGQCHQLNGQGGAIGPDLTGSDRGNLNYLLLNILNPSAVVADAYRQTTLKLKDGRTLAGVVRTRTAQTLTLQTLTETTTLPLADLAAELPSPLSLMPAGLLDALGETNARHLIAYLMDKNPPVAPPPTKP